MSIKIGITGGIGSGKSVVSRLFGIMGIPVYISDIEAKRITQTDPVICQELCALVGQDVFQNGVLNRSLLASYMFGHPNRVQKVNEIIHPQVKEDFRRWAARFGGEQLEVWSLPYLWKPVLGVKLIFWLWCMRRWK